MAGKHYDRRLCAHLRHFLSRYCRNLSDYWLNTSQQKTISFFSICGIVAKISYRDFWNQLSAEFTTEPARSWLRAQPADIWVDRKPNESKFEQFILLWNLCHSYNFADWPYIMRYIVLLKKASHRQQKHPTSRLLLLTSDLGPF